MSADNTHKILNAEETFHTIKQRVEEDEYRDWVNLCWVVDDVGYDQLTVTAEQLQDVLDKVLSSEHLQVHDPTHPSGRGITGKFGGNPLPRDVDTKAISEEIVADDNTLGLLTALMVAPYPDLHKWPWE